MFTMAHIHVKYDRLSFNCSPRMDLIKHKFTFDLETGHHHIS